MDSGNIITWTFIIFILTYTIIKLFDFYGIDSSLIYKYLAFYIFLWVSVLLVSE
uniref:Uncharacterized protein n=1 Tax=viral metagenome TaxID=1070528 RepID=A0A6C0H7C4_9ZZZZ